MATRIKKIGTEHIKSSSYPLVIGYFGCIHVMHERLLTKHHPFNVLTFADFETKIDTQIYPMKDRLANISKFGPDNIYVFNITKNNLSAENFVNQVLKKINPSKIIVGGDFKFGYDRQDVEFLKKHFTVEVISYNPQVSTTLIYQLIQDQKLEAANALMFFPYYYRSKWVEGAKNGRKLGANTINLLVDHKCILHEGSYIATITLGRKKYHGVAFYGQSKTFGVSHPTLEVHVINQVIFPRFLMPSAIKNNVKVEFLKFLRTNNKFLQKEELVTAIRNDIQAANDYFAHNK